MKYFYKEKIVYQKHPVINKHVFYFVCNICYVKLKYM